MGTTAKRRAYAAGTGVSTEKSRAEIRRVLSKHGAEHFQFTDGPDSAEVRFIAKNGRLLRFVLPLPSKSDRAFAMTPGGRRARSPEDRERAWEQACRSRWRSLALVIKAKLEAVASGIVAFEAEFLAHIVVSADGTTVGEWLAPELQPGGRFSPGAHLRALGPSREE